jgi:hypothetical protein
MAALPLPVSGLETRLRLAPDTLTGPDKDAAETYIEDATALVLDEVPAATADLWQVSVPRTVELVIYKAARREWENPSGLSQEISGEHTITTSATSGVFLTPLELQKVRNAAGIARGAVGSASISAPETPFTPYWWRRNW